MDMPTMVYSAAQEQPSPPSLTMRPSVRLAALVGLPVFYIWTHDSVGVGEDGPTHQPVETTSALRCIPNLDVLAQLMQRKLRSLCSLD